ncbi:MULTISPECIES: hypothetical protein [Komagataeibacter]|uniref:hypothetical protein n=1 Tax=Komagataeibacter TaxID=1434011 RepID=UPI001650F2D8|nr:MULTISPECIES: hypothetical protein [Komagataeibacter]
MKKQATGPGRNTTARRAGGQAMPAALMRRIRAARGGAWCHRMCGRNPRGVQSILGHDWGRARPGLIAGAGPSVSTGMPSGFLSMGNTGAAASGRAWHVPPRRGVAGM